MEAVQAAELPDGEGWQFEPKWDGFRCLALKERGAVQLISKSGKPLGRYFPEVVAAVEALAVADVLLDGELIVPAGDTLSFDALQLRLHPAESRVRRLAAETPAQFMLFDLLSLDGEPLADLPLAQRRQALERFHRQHGTDSLLLSPATTERDAALAWLERSGGALDGVIAKRLDAPYCFGERAMVKVKQLRSADCVVGGFRYSEKAREVGSLLLGLYDADCKLHHVGFTSGISERDRPQLTQRLEALIEPPGFTGAAPGGPSRWANARSAEWQPLRPELVVEVRYDQVTSRRFRHGTALLRWRPDKAPRQCTFDQLAPALRPSELKELFG
jgi:ATP-dependent DNA ligase